MSRLRAPRVAPQNPREWSRWARSQAVTDPEELEDVADDVTSVEARVTALETRANTSDLLHYFLS